MNGLKLAKKQIKEAATSGAIKLNLSRIGLEALPSEIGQLTNLQTLYLSGNQLRQLPPEIGQLTNLQSLDLWDNQLSQNDELIKRLSNQLKEQECRVFF